MIFKSHPIPGLDMGGYLSYSGNTNSSSSSSPSLNSNSSRVLTIIEEDPDEVIGRDMRLGDLPSSQTSGLDLLITTGELCAATKDYELDINSLEIGQQCTNEFGTGTFGRIIKHAIIHNLWFANEASNVIVKESVLTSNGFEYNTEFTWKSFLREINTLAWIGWHENIVTFLGLGVGDIQKRQLYIVCEYCKNGNLRDYLRRIDIQRNHHQHTVTKVDVNIAPRGPLLMELGWDDICLGPEAENDLKLFLKFISEIASAMEFLVSRRVVLVELTANAIHLTENLTVKLENFTLARVLKSDEDSFILIEQTPLPWRVLAPECFDKLKFSTESDIWAFGTLIWEIFSYGQHPFAGFQWTNSFVQNLKDGLRLDRLSNIPPSLFEFMECCWNVNVEERPSFVEASDLFRDLMEDE